MEKFSSDELSSDRKRGLIKADTQTSSVYWDDLNFLHEYVKKLKRKERPTLDTSVLYAKKFLIFYYTGMIEPGDVAETVACLLYSVKLKGEYIIQSERLIGDDPWEAPSGVTKWRSEPTTDIFFDMREGENNTSATREVTDPHTGASLGLMDLKYISSWAETLWKTLDSGTNIARQTVINYSAFLAGISSRLIIKDNNWSVDKHLVTMGSNRFTSLFNTNLGVKFTAFPNSEYYKMWAEHVTRASPAANRILTILIVAKLDAPTIMRSDVEGLLRAMCLLSLSSIGLGALSWGLKAAYFRMDITKFLSKMYMGIFRETVETLYNFLKFLCDHEQRTYMYARLF